MRILHVVHTIDPASGGTAEAIKQLSLACVQRGHVVEIASLDAPAMQNNADNGSYSFPLHALGPGRNRYGYSKALIPWLREHACRFDVVVVNGLWQYQGLATWRALCIDRKSGSVPYVVFPHGMLDPWFKRTYPFKHLKKWLYWPWAEYRVLRDAAAVLFTAEDERRLARESFWLYRCNEQVVTLGIADPPADHAAQRSAFLSAFPQLAQTRNMLFLGRIHEKKGCDLLLRAFPVLARADERWRLIIAGPDPGVWRPYLEAEARRLGIAERVVWAGMLQGDNKWGAFRSAEVFVLPSHQENFGLAVAEALACGVPVLISKRINIWREIIDDGAGFADDDDQAGCDALLTRWRDTTPAVRDTMATAARCCYQRRFEIGRATALFISALTSIVTIEKKPDKP